MHPSQILLGLLTTVSAIDIYGHKDNEKCRGNSIVCTNANSGDCCVRASGEIFRSIQIREIPTDWRIIGLAYGGSDCGNVKLTVGSNGEKNICLGGNTYSGGKYIFASQKRSEGADKLYPATGSCTSVKRGDSMVFEDGRKYDLTGLDDTLYTEVVNISLIALFENGGNSTDVPAKFDAYKIE